MSTFSEETGFDGYEPSSVDPGPSVLIATIIFCVLSLATLPCLMSLRRQCERRRSRDGAESGTESDDAKIKTSDEKAAESKGSVKEDDISVVSAGSSVAASVFKSILDHNPRAGTTTRRGKARMEKYHNKLRLLEPSEDIMVPATVGRTESHSDSRSVSNASAMSKLDQDAVSIQDAVDNVNGAAIAVDRNKIPRTPQEPSSCWSPARVLDGLLEIAEFDYEMKRICRLATPFVLRAFSSGVLEAINVAIVARFIGTSEVAAYVTVDMVVGLSSSLFSGFHESLTTLCSQAIGARNKKLAGQYMQIAIVLFIVCFAPIIVLWMIYMEDTLRWFGFDEYTVRVGTDFARIYVFVEVIEAVDKALYALLDTIGKEGYSGFISTFSELASTAAVIGVALSPDPSLERVGLVFLFVSAGSMFLNVLIIMWKGWYDDFLGGIIGSCALGNGKAFKLMLKTSASLSLGFLLSYSEWEFLALTAKTLGPAEVTAWGLLGTLWDIVEMVSEAVADAAEVRCAMLLGAGRPERAKLSAYKSIYVATFISLFISACVFIAGDDLPTWMTTDATLQRMLADLIPLFGVGNIALTLGTIAWTCVGSQGRYRLSTAVGFFGSWFVTIPMAAICTIVLDLDLRGQTAAVVVGYMVSGTINAYLLLTSDWERLSREVIEANADVSSESSSSSSDDDALSASRIGPATEPSARRQDGVTRLE